MSETHDFTIGNHVFTLGVNTVRQDRGRTALYLARGRFVYGENTFESELERMSALESMDPFYTDIVGCARALDGDQKNPLLLSFIREPRLWDDFYWDNFDTLGELVEAVQWSQKQHPHWYPKPQVTAEDAPEAKATVDAAKVSVDPDSTQDVDQPPPEDIHLAVQERADIAKEKRDPDFLGQSK